MRVLLDPHAFLWMLEASPRLSARARSLINDPGNRVLVSMASIWEITIKQARGKLQVPPMWDAALSALRGRWSTSVLNIEFRDLDELLYLPHHHGDPFDRMLVAQCFARGLQLISNDAALDDYGISRLW